MGYEDSKTQPLDRLMRMENTQQFSIELFYSVSGIGVL